jgi:DNA repair protein RadC
MQPIIGELPHEEFWIIYLNNSNKVISKHNEQWYYRDTCRCAYF